MGFSLVICNLPQFKSTTVSQKKKQGPVKAKPINTEVNSKPATNNETAAKSSQKQGKPFVQPVADFFDQLGNKAPLVALGLILFIGVIVFRDFLFFNKVYFFKDIGSDTLNYSYPYAHTVADYISKYGIPKWSFNFGIGQSLFPFFLRDPFDIILYIAGKDHFVYAMAYKEFIKIVLGGFTFYYYLRTIKLSEYASMIGGVLFAYSGFMIVGSGWYIFSFEAFNMALMLLGFELLFSQNKWFLFLLAIFLICISQPFNLFVYGVFFVTYVFFRYFQEGVFSWKAIGIMFLKIAGLGILAILLSGPFMLENVVQLLESPRGSGNTSYTNLFSNAPMFGLSQITDLGVSVMRFFSSDMLGTGNDLIVGMVTNTNTLEAPMFYCGLPCLLLMPQVFPFLTRKVKISFLVIIVLWMAPIIFPYFRFAFWLFTGNYFRGYSIIVAFFMMYFSLFALDLIVQKKKINIIILVITLVCLYALLNYHYFPDVDEIKAMLRNTPAANTNFQDKEVINSSIFVFVSVMLLVYAVILFFMGRKDSPVYLKYLFMGVLVFELIYLSNISVNGRDTMLSTEVASKTKGYNDYSVEAINYIKQNDHSFYRIDKVYGSSPAMHYSINDGMAQDYMGTSGYSPFNEITYVLYLQLMGLASKENELQSRWAVGVAYHPILESENQVKYLLAKGPINFLSRATSDSLATFGNVTVYRNKYVLPLGYTYGTFLRSSNFVHLSPDQKEYMSLRACVVDDSDANKMNGFREFNLNDTSHIFSFDLYKQYTDDLRKDTLNITHFGQTHITGKIDLPEQRMMYLSIPFDKGWTVRVDGQVKNKIALFGGMTGILLPQGHHEIELSYELRFFGYGVYLSIIGLILLGGLWFYLGKKKAAAEGRVAGQ